MSKKRAKTEKYWSFRHIWEVTYTTNVGPTTQRFVATNDGYNIDGILRGANRLLKGLKDVTITSLVRTEDSVRVEIEL